MKNKKSLVYSTFMLFVFLIFTLSLFIILDNKYKELSASKTLGEKQMELFNSYSKGEKAMLYIDRAAEIAAEEALYDSAEMGGTLNPAGGQDRDDGYVYWQEDDLEAFPTKQDIEQAYEFAFNMRISSYLSQYQEEPVSMPYSFDITLNDGLDIKGTSNNDLIIGETPSGYNAGLYGTGKCGYLVDFAFKYLGATYGGANHCPPPGYPGAPFKCTMQCGSFVTSVYMYSGLEPPWGNGKSKCNGPLVSANQFKDPSLLKPGDIFSSSSSDIANGHTGMYVGLGRIDGGLFVPDGNGEPIFIHATPPVVKLSTYDELFGSGKRVLYNFCRHRECIGEPESPAKAEDKPVAETKKGEEKSET